MTLSARMSHHGAMINQSLHVRKDSGAGEWPALVCIWRSAVEATHDFITAADIDRYESKMITDYFPHVVLWVAADATDQPVGFIGMSDHHIEMLFVDPGHHGSGAGTALLNHVGAHHARLIVDVNEQNPAAIGFYRHQGFIEIGRSPLDAEGKPFPLLHLSRP